MTNPFKLAAEISRLADAAERIATALERQHPRPVRGTPLTDADIVTVDEARLWEQEMAEEQAEPTGILADEDEE